MAEKEVCAMEKILQVKRGVSGGFGFSLMGGLDTNLPPVICDILDNSPASECPGMQIGDIILEINQEKILGKSVKEAVSCLMKSPDCLVLKVKEDAKIKKRVEKFMEPITKDLNQKRLSTESSSSEPTSPAPNFIRLTSSGKQLEKAGLEGSQRSEISRTDKLSAGVKSPSSKFTFTEKQNTLEKNIIDNNIMDHRVPENGSQSTVLVKTDLFTPLSKKCEHGTRDQFPSSLMSSSTDSSLSDLAPGNKVLITSALIHREDSTLSGAANAQIMDTNSNKIEPVIHLNGHHNVSADEEMFRHERRHDSGVGGSSDGSAADSDQDLDSMNSQVNEFVLSTQETTSKTFEETHFNEHNDGENITHHSEQDVIVSNENSPTVSRPHDFPSDSKNFLAPQNSLKKSPTKTTPQGALRLSHSTGCLEISQSSSSNQDSFPEEEPIQRSASCSTIDSEDALDMKTLEDAIMNSSNRGLDKPSAKRLAKRLFLLDGFKRSDVAKHLSKRNDFSQIVAEEYLNYFNFANEKLDTSLRKFLKAITLVGETQERERILTHFSRRYNECNPGKFKSSDTVHTLVCAMLLLNTDLHGQNIGKKMTLQAFQLNLERMNDGEDFPKDLLKRIYQSIKMNNIQWAKGEAQDITFQTPPNGTRTLSGNPFMELQNDPNAPVFMQGYIMRKNIKEGDGKKTPKGKRSWRMYYAVIKGLILYLHKSDIASQLNFHKPKESYSLHHCLATKDTEYSKRTNVFRVRHSDWSEYLTQCSDANEVQLWMQAFNIAAATLSTPPLPAGCGSLRRFTRPLLPSATSKLSRTEQLQNHESKVEELERELEEHRSFPPDKGARPTTLKDWNDKREYLEYEVTRFKTYVYLLQSNVGNPLLTMHSPPSSSPSPITSSVSLKKPTSQSMSKADDVQRRAPNTKVFRLASSPGRLKNVLPLPINEKNEDTYL